MDYFSLDCRCNPELAAKSAPTGVGQNRGKAKFFAKNETSHLIPWALPACLRNFNSLHALVWSERPTLICQNLRKFHPCDLRSKLILVELQLGVSQRILRLFSRGKTARLDNFVDFLGKKIFRRKMAQNCLFFARLPVQPRIGPQKCTPRRGTKQGESEIFCQ